MRLESSDGSNDRRQAERETQRLMSNKGKATKHLRELECYCKSCTDLYVTMSSEKSYTSRQQCPTQQAKRGETENSSGDTGNSSWKLASACQPPPVPDQQALNVGNEENPNSMYLSIT